MKAEQVIKSLRENLSDSCLCRTIFFHHWRTFSTFTCLCVFRCNYICFPWFIFVVINCFILSNFNTESDFMHFPKHLSNITPGSSAGGLNLRSLDSLQLFIVLDCEYLGFDFRIWLHARSPVPLHQTWRSQSVHSVWSRLKYRSNYWID